MRRNILTSGKPQKRRQQAKPSDSAAHENAAKLSPAQRLGSLGGAARARNLTAEQRREIAQKAAAKRWERFERYHSAPSNSSDTTPQPAAGHDGTTELIERNHRLLSRAADVRLRSEEVIAQSENAVGWADASSGTGVAPCSSRIAWRNRR